MREVPTMNDNNVMVPDWAQKAEEERLRRFRRRSLAGRKAGLASARAKKRRAAEEKEARAKLLAGNGQ